MALTIHDFFNPDNIVTRLDEKLYDNTDIYIETARAFARSTYQPVFIVDFYRQNFLYTSGNLRHLCGINAEQLHINDNNLYFDHVPPDEETMLKEIIEKAFELLNTFPVEERTEWILSYYFHLQYSIRKRLVFHKITPLSLSPDGKVWLALCTFSMSSRKEAGYPSMRKYKQQEYFHYSLKKHVWYFREGLTLTEMEHDILLLSSQGYTMKEIAATLYKSEDTIKSYKRQLFPKLGVKNITEAVFAAINSDLLH